MKLLAPFALVIFSLCPSAYSDYSPRQIRFINKCNERVLISVVSHVRSIGDFYYAGEGWRPLDPGKETIFLTSNGSNPYTLVQTQSGRPLTGADKTFCVSGSPYTFRAHYNENKNLRLIYLKTNQDSGFSETCGGVGGHFRKEFQRLDYNGKRAIAFTVDC